LQELLSSPTQGRQAAEGFRTVVSPSDDVLTAEMHANIRIMYRQRFFMENLKPIVDGYQAAADG